MSNVVSLLLENELYHHTCLRWIYSFNISVILLHDVKGGYVVYSIFTTLVKYMNLTLENWHCDCTQKD